MANIKVSEMTEATIFDNGDYTMIIQGNASKKISKENMLGDIEENIENLGTYSTTEIDTGKTWIDGKKIYRKVVDFGQLPDNTTKEVNPNISNFGRLTQPILGFTYKDNSIDSYPLPFVTTVDPIYFIDLIFTIDGNIRIRTKTDRTEMSAYIILEYTKIS